MRLLSYKASLRYAFVVTLPLVSGCADTEDETAFDQGMLDGLPVLPEAVGDHAEAFRGNVPGLALGDQPADTLREVRSLVDADSLGMITEIAIVGDALLLADRYMDPHLILVDLSDGRVANRFGRHGEGPGEFRDPSMFGIADIDPLEVWVYDFSNRRYTRLRVAEMDGAEVSDQFAIEVGTSLEHPIRARNQIVSNGLFHGHTLLVMDSVGRPLARTVVEPPFSLDEFAGDRSALQLNRNFLSVDESGSRLVAAYQFESRLDFFLVDGSHYGSITGPRETTARFARDDATGVIQWEQDNELAYLATAATDDFAYALFCGCTDDEFELSATKIHVFRWNGDFVAELELDRPITNFTVSSEDDTLYAAYSYPLPGVGQWALPDLTARLNAEAD